MDDVISAFQDEGLEVKNVKETDLRIPKADDGKTFEIPSLGKYNEGFVFSYDDETVLDTMKSFYNETGSEIEGSFDQTIKHKNILVRLMGPNMDEKEYNEYKNVLDNLR